MKSYYDIVGDGGSRILEQVEQQRSRVEAALANVRHVVAIGSGKGGVGKSTLTWHLAEALRGMDRRVAVLDADLNGPCQARLAGLGAAPWVPGDRGLGLPRTAAGIGVVSLGAIVPETDALDFDSVAAGDSHVWRATREFAFLGQLIGSVEWGVLDLLLVDLPPGAERTVQYAEFLGRPAAFVLVTLPSELSWGVVSRSIAALKQTENAMLGTIENMSGYYCNDCEKLQPLFAQSTRVDLGLPRLGSVPFDPDLAARCDRGASLADRPARATTRALREIAANLIDVLEEDR